MSIVTVQGNAGGTGTLTVTSPNTNSNYTVTLPTATTTLVGTDATQTLTNKTLTSPTLTSPTISGTPVMGASVITSGTVQTAPPATPQYFDFTGIPSWVKRVTVMISGLSGNGTSDFLFQLGDSGGIEASGYAGCGALIGSSTAASTSYTTGFGFAGGANLKVWQGAIRFTNLTGNTWVADGVFGRSDGNNTAQVGGGKTLSATLDRVRITHVNGTDTFDAGSINILYE